MNLFDFVICFAATVAAVTGFRSGLLRGLAMIIGYLSAMPIAVAATSLVTPAFAVQATAPWNSNSMFFFAAFLITGTILGSLLRSAVGEVFGQRIALGDRLAGSLLGIFRVGLVAITLVLIFDRLIPADQQPAWLTGSTARPALSMLGQTGLKSLPSDVTAYVDQLKKERRL